MIPKDLLAHLQTHPEAHARFEALPPSHPREYIKWIDYAKKPQTQRRRIEETARKLGTSDEQALLFLKQEAKNFCYFVVHAPELRAPGETVQ